MNLIYVNHTTIDSFNILSETLKLEKEEYYFYFSIETKKHAHIRNNYVAIRPAKPDFRLIGTGSIDSGRDLGFPILAYTKSYY